MKVTKQRIKSRAQEILRECFSLVPEQAGFMQRIRFRVSARMTRAAGKARPSTGEITLSLPYFEDVGNFEKEFRNTVTHEIAHVLSPPYRNPGSRKSVQHGHRWQAMHRRLGGTGERCHELELSAGYERKRRGRAERTSVPCPKCEQPMSLGPTQLKKYRMGARYSHSRCPR